MCHAPLSQDSRKRTGVHAISADERQQMIVPLSRSESIEAIELENRCLKRLRYESAMASEAPLAAARVEEPDDLGLFDLFCV